MHCFLCTSKTIRMLFLPKRFCTLPCMRTFNDAIQIVLLSLLHACAVVQCSGKLDDFAFLWNMRFPGTRKTKRPWPIDMRFCTINNVDGIIKFSKRLGICLLGETPKKVTYKLLLLFCIIIYLTFAFFLYCPTNQTAGLICTHVGLNEAVCMVQESDFRELR